MKHLFTKIVVLVALCFGFNSNLMAQCIATTSYSSFPTTPACPVTTPVNSAATDCWAGEYTTVTGLVAGHTYSAANSNATYYITVTDATSTTVYASGTTPVVFTAPVSGDYRLHRHTSGPPTCGTGTASTTASIAWVAAPALPDAPLAGVYNVPGNPACGEYASLAQIIDSLNANGVSAPVTINLTAAETAPAGGYDLGSATLNASLSATNTLTFNGGNNALTAHTGVNIYTDCIWDIAGCDYVTVDNFTFLEAAANTTPNTRMEYGLRFSMLSTTDGCQNINITNNTVDLTYSSTSANEDNQCGIAVINILNTSTTASNSSTTTPASAAGNHENVVITDNTITQSYNGIYVRSSTTGTADRGIMNVTIDNNNVTFGTQAGADVGFAEGIYAYYIDGDVSVSYNTVLKPNTADGGGYGIYLYSHDASPANTANMIGNDISMSELATTTASTTHYGLYYSNNSLSNGIVAHIDSNNLHDFVMSTTDLTSGTLYGIYTFGSYCSMFTLNGNTVSNITKNSGTTYGLYTSVYDNYAANQQVVNDNKVSGITHLGTSGTNYVRGMYINGDAQRNFQRDTVENITVSGTATTTTQYIIGVQDYSYGAPLTGHLAEDIVVRNITNNMSRGHVTGYQRFNSVTYATGGNNVMNRINVSGLTNNASAVYTSTTSGFYSGLSGITLEASAYPQTLTNSFVSGLSAPNMVSNTSNLAVWGVRVMYEDVANVYKIYNNTIALGQGAPLTGGATFSVYGIGLTNHGGGIAPADLRNNIVSVNATPSGTGYVAAVNEMTAGTMDANSNNNIYYAPNAANSYLYSNNNGANSYNLTNDPNFNTGCGAYKTFKSPAEGASNTENNLVAGALPNTFVPSGASLAEGSAQSLTEVPMDYASVARAATPDVGALEFAGIGAGDLVAPTITYTDMADKVCLDNPTLDAAITDLSNVNTTASTAPRLYYKKSTEANALVGNTAADNGWKWVQSASTASPFSFTMDYALLNSAAAAGDIIEYFVVAQDLATTPNVGTFAATYNTGFCPTSVDISAPVGATPITGTKSFTILTAPTITGMPATDTLCVSGDVDLSTSLAGSITDPSVTWQWESAPLGTTTWAALATATTENFTVVGQTASTDYQLLMTCPSPQGLVATSTTASVYNLIPTVDSVIHDTLCPGGVMTLGAYCNAAAGGGDVNWYDNFTDATPVLMGSNTYTTPSLTATDTLWAACATGSPDTAFSPAFSTTYASTCIRGNWFVAQSNFTIFDAYVPTNSASGAQHIGIYKCSGTLTNTTELYYANNLSATDWIPVNVPVTMGDTIMVMGYRTTTGTAAANAYTTATTMMVDGIATDMHRATGPCTFNTVQPTTGFSGSTTTTGSKGKVDFITGKGCEGARVPVVAWVPLPADLPFNELTAGGDDSICNGEMATIMVGDSIVDIPAYMAPVAGCTPASGNGCIYGDNIGNFATTGGSTNITNNTGTACPAGPAYYTDYTATQQATFMAGETVNLTVQTGSTLYSQGFRVWVDYNGNGTFGDVGEDVWNSATWGTAAYTGSFVIPAATVPGTYRMRVRNSYNSVPTAAQFCSTMTYSETEDYALIVGTKMASVGNTYAWSPVTVPGNTAGPEVTPAMTATGIYTVTSTDASMCTNTATWNVEVAPAMNLAVSPITADNCLGSSTDLIATATGTPTYLWMPGSTTNATLPVPYYSSGSYTVTATDAFMCTETASATLTISIPSGDLTQAGLSNASSTPGMQMKAFTHPNDGLAYGYFDATCNLISTVQESAPGSLGNVDNMVTVDATTPVWVGQPYVARWYDISPDVSAPATITLYATDDDFITYNANNGAFPDLATNAGSATATTNLAITQITGGPLGTGTVTAVHTDQASWNAASSRWEVTINVTGFSQFFLHTQNPNNVPLPVVYKSFTVKKQASTDLVEWTVSSEKNNKHYVVQRSADGSNFENLGTVASMAPNGTTNLELSYSFVDESPQLGHNYYRLAQVDIDDNVTNSKVIDIIWGAAGSVVTVYPNPATDKLNIDLSTDKVANVEVKLLDMSGRIVKSIQAQTVSGLNSMNISLQDLASGIYGVQVYENNKLTHVQKVRKND